MDERIDIVVQDRVALSISTKLDRITGSARAGADAVERLKAQLAALNTGPIQQLQTQLSLVNGILNQNALAQQRLATETAKTATATARAATALSQSQTAATAAATATQSLTTATANSSKAQAQAALAAQRTATETQRTAAQTANAAAASDRAALAALRFQQAQDRAAQSAQGLNVGIMNIIRSAAALAGIGLSAHAILDAAEAYTVLQNKLRNVVDSEAQLAEVTNLVFDVANRTRSGVQETAQAFTRFDMALKQLGASQGESIRMTETINKMIKISGATSHEAGSALLQLSQAFNKGKLDGDEFRSVMELMPQAADAIAKQLKVTRGELLLLAPQGKITAEVMRKAFAAVAADVDAKFGKTVPTIGEAFVVLRNSATQFFGELNKALGITQGISKAILFLSDNMKGLAVVLSIVGSMLLVAFGPSLVAMLSAATSAVLAFSAAVLLNPIGLLVVGLTAAIAVLTIFSDEITKNNDLTTAWYYELTDLINFVGRYFAPILQTVIGYFGDFGKEIEKMGIGAFILQTVIKGLMAVIKELAYEAANIVFAFKIVGKTIGAAAAQLVAIGKLDFTGAKAISEAFVSDFNSARKEMEDFKKDVKDFGSDMRIESGIKLLNTVPTPSPVSTLRGTGPAAKIRDPKAEKEAEKRAMALSHVNAELDKELKGLTTLKLERDIQSKFDQIEINLASKKIKLHENERKSILEKIKTIENAKAVQQAFDQIYEEATGPLRDYNATLIAADKLLNMGAISQDQYRRSVTKASETYKQATDPLYGFNKGLSEQMDLLTKVGPQQEIAQQMQQLQNELLAKGVELNNNQKSAIESKLVVLQNEKLMNQELNKIYSETAGALKANQLQIEANQKAFDSGLLTLDQYSQRLTKLTLDATNLRIKLGEGSLNDVLTAGLGNVVSQYENVASSLTNSFTDFFQSFSDGFANSVGQAVVHSKNLGDALQNVATQAVEGLISSLVKLGVQYTINAALGRSVGTAAMAAQTVASVTAATTTAAAWAPAATMVSLASFGANAAAAMTGITATAALSEGLALASIAGFEQGGYTGNVGRKQVAGVVHGQEFVVSADATRRNRAVLEAMNNGGKAVAMNSTSNSNQTAGGSNVSVKIENYGTSKEFEVQQLSENEVRVIARDEAKNMVRSEAPNVISASISNPNSTVSKSLNKNTQTQRRRNG